MIRTLLKVVVVVILIAAATAFFVGYRFGDDGIETPVAAQPGAPAITTEKARATGAAIGEAVATGAVKAQHALDEGALTAKIKSKMALDDYVRARSIDVTTVDHVVTLTGTVRTTQERDRALQLARETDGVTRVVDRLTMSGTLP